MKKNWEKIFSKFHASIKFKFENWKIKYVALETFYQYLNMDIGKKSIEEAQKLSNLIYMKDPSFFKTFLFSADYDGEPSFSFDTTIKKLEIHLSLFVPNLLFVIPTKAYARFFSVHPSLILQLNHEFGHLLDFFSVVSRQRPSFNFTKSFLKNPFPKIIYRLLSPTIIRFNKINQQNSIPIFNHLPLEEIIQLMKVKLQRNFNLQQNSIYEALSQFYALWHLQDFSEFFNILATKHMRNTPSSDGGILFLFSYSKSFSGVAEVMDIENFENLISNDTVLSFNIEQNRSAIQNSEFMIQRFTYSNFESFQKKVEPMSNLAKQQLELIFNDFIQMIKSFTQ